MRATYSAPKPARTTAVNSRVTRDDMETARSMMGVESEERDGHVFIFHYYLHHEIGPGSDLVAAAAHVAGDNMRRCSRQD